MSWSWGPTVPWVSVEDLGCDVVDDTDPVLVAAVLAGATETLYFLTARLITGRLAGTVRLHGLIPQTVHLRGPDPVVSAISIAGEAFDGTWSIYDGHLLVPGPGWPAGRTANDDSFIVEFDYTYGPDVPEVAKTALRELACRTLNDFAANGCSLLAPGVSSASFQGTSVSIDPEKVLAASLGSVRLLVDLLNPLQQRQPSELFSPDIVDDLSVYENGGSD